MSSPIHAAHSPGDAHSSDMFDFPAPPSQPSAHAPNQTGSEFPKHTLNPTRSPRQDDPGIDVARFKHMSRSTASLPVFDRRNTSEFQESEDSSDDQCSAEDGKVYRQPRAAQSHYNLHCVDDNAPLSESFLSLVYKGEQMSEIAHLMSPIASGSFESDMAKSSGTITLVSHTHENDVPPLPRGRGDQRPPARDNNAEPITPSSSQGGVPFVKLRKQMSMAQMEARYNNRNSMVVSDMLFPLEIGDSSNGAPSVDDQQPPSEAKRRQSRFDLDFDFPLDLNIRPNSRYLYDVPNAPMGSSEGSGRASSKALQSSHRLSQSVPVQLRRTRSSIINHHKIYDIYEESIWHIAHTATPVTSQPDGRDAASKHGMTSLSAGSPANRAAPASSGNVDSNTRARILHSVKSFSAPWHMVRSWKNRDTRGHGRSQSYMSSISSASTCSSDESYCGPFTSGTDSKDLAPRRKPSALHLFVRRAGRGLLRHSASFYKTLSGSSLASDDKNNNNNNNNTSSSHDSSYEFSDGSSGSSSSVSHMRRVGGEEHHDLLSGNSSTLDESPAPGDGNMQKIGRRFASVVRQASNKLKGTLRPPKKGATTAAAAAAAAAQEDSGDIVSAYPADSLTGEELDKYLSRSAINSPVIPVWASSRASTGSDESATCDSGPAAAPASYMPPKRPPYLGLHRKSVTDYGSGNAGPAAAGYVNPALELPPAGSVRLRATQFSSPFTTLPYGAHVQLNQLKSQHHYM
ncbi:hypothetical protein GGF46_000295 [Coemansia sp. RSA 552]|nr:hypothetical protein GGF46_000295 [Coemansia sp. RSA 552]